MAAIPGDGSCNLRYFGAALCCICVTSDAQQIDTAGFTVDTHASTPNIREAKNWGLNMRITFSKKTFAVLTAGVAVASAMLPDVALAGQVAPVPGPLAGAGL